MVTHNIGTLEGVQWVKLDKKPNFTVFLTKCTLNKCYPQWFTYHHHPHQFSEYFSNIIGIPSPAFEIFPGFNFVKSYLVTITPGCFHFTFSYENNGKTVVFPAISQLLPFKPCANTGKPQNTTKLAYFSNFTIHPKLKTYYLHILIN